VDTHLSEKGHPSMTGDWPFLVVALLLLVLVFFLLHRSVLSEQHLASSQDSHGVSAAQQLEFFPQLLAERIFGSQDWDFMVRQGSPQHRRLFLQQRRTLALSCLRGARVNATRIMRVHAAAAGRSSQLEPLTEVRIVRDFLVIQALCQMLSLLVWFRGPVHLGRLIGHADKLCKRLCEVTEKLLPAELAAENDGRAPGFHDGHGGG
jgi:hypothetical protein